MTNRMRSLNSLNEALADGCPLCESNSRTEFADLGTFTKHMEGHLLFPMKPEELAKDNIRVITTDKKVIVTKDLVGVKTCFYSSNRLQASDRAYLASNYACLFYNFLFALGAFSKKGKN